MKKKQKLGPLQREWIKALRDGKFKRKPHRLIDKEFEPTKGVLTKLKNNIQAHCCLGVASCVVRIHHPRRVRIKFATDLIDAPDNARVKYNGHGFFLSPEVQSIMKFRGREGERHNHYSSLSGDNDAGCTFKEIAEKVERNPAAYFTGPA